MRTAGGAPLDLDEVHAAVCAARAPARMGFAVACFTAMQPAHERAIRDVVGEQGSSATCRLTLAAHRQYERAITAVLNEFVRPAMSGYLGRIEAYSRNVARRAPSDHAFERRRHGGGRRTRGAGAHAAFGPGWGSRPPSIPGGWSRKPRC